MESSKFQQRISRILRFVGDLTARASMSAIIVAVLGAFFVALAADGFKTSWEEMFATIVSSISLIMIFVLQHTQSRHQAVLQLKLDELIRSSPEADDRLVHLEDAKDEEIIEQEQQLSAHHEAVRGNDELEIIEFNPPK
jgi:low affinity Fe/Cu permease